MFDNIEEIYIINNTEGKKYKKWILPVVIVLAILMFILIITRKIILSYISILVVVLLMIILKIIIYLNKIQPKGLLDILFLKEKYKKITYSITKDNMVRYLKENNIYNIDTVNILVDYYKDFEVEKKFDISKISNYIFSFLSVLGVVLTIYNMNVLNTIYLIALFILMIIAIFYLENKFLDKLSEGILDSRINYKELYKMFTEIYLDIVNNKNKLNIKENKILDESFIEQFSTLFEKYLKNYKLSYFFRSKEDNFSKENIIHSSIIWIRFCVNQINESRIFNGSTKSIELYTLISIIDTLKEGLDQIYRVLYNTDNNEYGDDKALCFKDLPEPYNKLKNSQCFKEIRAIFAIHPSNLKMPDNKEDRRYADLCYAKSEFSKIANRKGDFYTRIWTRTKNDEATIYFPLYVKDLIDFSKLIYSQLEQFIIRLEQIANKKHEIK